MPTELLHPHLSRPLAQVQDRIETELSDLAQLTPAPHHWAAVWQRVLDLCRAPRHLLRPQLVLIGAGGEDTPPEAAVELAAAVELLHVFMLIHDDVMDGGSQRRGMPTLHMAISTQLPTAGVATSSSLAMVVGDLLHSRAMAMLLDISHAAPGGRRACQLILAGADAAGRGQFADLLGWQGLGEGEGSAERLLALLRLKGAWHSVVAPLAAGWCLREPAADTSRLERWGHHIGLALQGADDLADLLGVRSLGKDALQDLREGRLSLPLWLLRQGVEGEIRDRLNALTGRGILTEHERGELLALIEKEQLTSRCVEFLHAEIDRAAALTPLLPPALEPSLRQIEARLHAHVAALGSPSP